MTSNPGFQFDSMPREGLWTRIIHRFFKKKNKEENTASPPVVSDDELFSAEDNDLLDVDDFFDDIDVAELSKKAAERMKAIMNMDAEERRNYERLRFRECKITLEDLDFSELKKLPITADDQIHTVRASSSTDLLGVEKPGEYMAIYDYRLQVESPEVKGTMLCICDVELYEYFKKIDDLMERAQSIGHFARFSPEQQQHLIELAKLEELKEDPEDHREALTAPRDVITNPYALKTMFQLCKHRLPQTLRYHCKELLEKHGEDNTQILANILYSCCENDFRQPFLSTEECWKVFRKRRFGDDPWIKDIIRRIRLLDRCENTGTVFVLVGEPGTGKTNIGISIAECTRKKFCLIHCNNKNALEIGGSSTMFLKATYGIIQESFRLHGPNTVFLLDEFEKMVIDDRLGNPFAFFNSVWDDRQTFTDEFTGVPISTKNTIWILTVNSVNRIPDYILNRFHANVFIVDAYSAEKKATIAERFIIPQFMEKYRFSENELRFTNEALLAIAKTTRDSGARIIGQKIDKVFGIINEKLENGAETPLIADKAFVTSAMQDSAKTMDTVSGSIGY